MSTEEVLTDLRLWMRRRLADSVDTVVEVPDWEMRLRLEAVEEALKNVNIAEPCPECQDRAQADGEASDGMTNAAEMAGL